MTRKPPPHTINPEARALIAAAAAKCAGCRMDWRIDARTGWKHCRVPGGLIECKAPVERAALRDIADRARAKEAQP